MAIFNSYVKLPEGIDFLDFFDRLGPFVQGAAGVGSSPAQRRRKSSTSRLW